MRDRLAHRYFDTQHSYVAYAVSQDLRPLEDAATRLLKRISNPSSADWQRRIAPLPQLSDAGWPPRHPDRV